MRSIEGEWLDLAAELLAQPLSTFPREPLAVQLATTLDAACCAFALTERDGISHGAIYPLSEQLRGHRARFEDWGTLNARYIHPVLLQYQATGRPTLLQVADVPVRFAPRRAQAAWRSFAAPAGCAEQLGIPLGYDPSGQLRSFVVGRDRAFSADELELTRRIWRLLIGIDSQAAALKTVSLGAVEAAADLRVTPRELAVIRLLAEGLTATAIGRRLAISERTVHKHLERAYAKLGVSDKLSAVQRAHRHGLLGGPAIGSTVVGSQERDMTRLCVCAPETSETSSSAPTRACRPPDAVCARRRLAPSDGQDALDLSIRNIAN
jgi:DNA-binding CsgD family transcriptional regulator